MTPKSRRTLYLEEAARIRLAASFLRRELPLVLETRVGRLTVDESSVRGKLMLTHHGLGRHARLSGQVTHHTAEGAAATIVRRAGHQV